MSSRSARNGPRRRRCSTPPTARSRSDRSQGGDAAPIEFTRAGVVHAHALQAAGRATSIRAAPRPVRGIMAPVISPDGTQVAFVALGDLWLMPIGSMPGQRAARADQRSLRRDGSDVVAGWPLDRVFIRSRRHDGSVGPRHRERRRAKRSRPTPTKASWAPRGTEIAYITREGALRDHRPQRAGSCADARCRPPDLGAGRADCRHDAAAVLEPVPRRHQSTADGVARPAAPIAASNPVAHHSIGTREHDGPVWSRDGSKMAFVMDGVMHVMPTTPTGEVSGAPRQLSDDLADSPSWAADSRRLLYQTAERLEAGRRHRRPHHRRAGQPDLAARRSRRAASSCMPAGCSTASRRDAAQQRRHRDSRQPHRAGRRPSRRSAHRPRHRCRQRRGDAGTDRDARASLARTTAKRSAASGSPTASRRCAIPRRMPTRSLEDKEAIGAGVRRGPRVFATGGPFDGSRIYYSGGVPLAGGTQLPQELQKTVAARLRPDQDLCAPRRSAAEAGDRFRARQRHAGHLARDLSGGRVGRRRRRAHPRHQPSRLLTEGVGAQSQLPGRRRPADRVEDDDHADDRHHRRRVSADARRAIRRASTMSDSARCFRRHVVRDMERHVAKARHVAERARGARPRRCGRWATWSAES